MTRRQALRWLGITVALGQAACAATRETLSATPEGRRILAEFDRYAKMADQLRKNHVNGALDDTGVREVLRKLGLAPAPARPAPGAPPAQPPKTFAVPVYKGEYRWPLEAGAVTSEFGQRWGGAHEGIDIAADLGVPVYTTAPGEVVYAGDKLGGYGNVIMVRHDQKTTSIYGHNRLLRVRTGEKVHADQVIASLGSTGRSTGPHVHFELRENDKSISPRAVLPKSRFCPGPRRRGSPPHLPSAVKR